MVDATQGDYSRPSIGQIARLLLESSRQEPALLGRRHPPLPDRMADSAGDLTPRADDPFPIQLFRNAPFDLTQHLEELVSIAVASAQQAEDAVQQAHAANGTFRRGMMIFAGIGVLGFLVGAAAIADNHIYGSSGTAVATTTVASPTPGPIDAPAESTSQPVEPQPRIQTALSGDAAATAEGNNTAPAPVPPSPLLTQAALAQTPTRPLAPPVYHGPQAGHAAPWPNDRPVRSYRAAPTSYYAAAPPRRVVYPGFFVSLRRDFGALIRGLPPNS
jgi:hypothetical protein